jgi:hypothetical protein
MAKLQLPDDFKEFLKLFDSNGVEYLLIGGYAVNVHGHVRTTNDLDIWVNISPENATRIERALRQFGFGTEGLSSGLFLSPHSMVRMGVPPIRIEVLTTISGVEFGACYAEREMIQMEDILVPVISLPRLRENKAASGRLKDLADLESLPEATSLA